MPLYISDIAGGDDIGYAAEAVAIETAQTFEPVNALRPVRLVGSQVGICHANDFSELQQFIGVARQAGSTGGEIESVTWGEHEDGSWSWTPGETIFVDDAGNLSHTPGAHILVVGKAWTPTKIFIAPETPIYVS